MGRYVSLPSSFHQVPKINHELDTIQFKSDESGMGAQIKTTQPGRFVVVRKAIAMIMHSRAFPANPLFDPSS